MRSIRNQLLRTTMVGRLTASPFQIAKLSFPLAASSWQPPPAPEPEQPWNSSELPMRSFWGLIQHSRPSTSSREVGSGACAPPRSEKAVTHSHRQS